MKKLLLAIVAVMVFLPSFSQVNDLTEADIQAFKDRTGEIIDMFQNNLGILGSKKFTANVKSVYKKSILKLFIGEGKPYDIEGQHYEGVHMQSSKIVKGKEIKANTPLITYLDNLIKLPYANVKITAADTYRISNIYKVGDHYEATATIFQRFEGFKGGRDGKGKVYRDVTQKSIKIWIVPENDFVLGQHWSVRLGDIDVAETTTE